MTSRGDIVGLLDEAIEVSLEPLPFMNIEKTLDVGRYVLDTLKLAANIRTIEAAPNIVHPQFLRTVTNFPKHGCVRQENVILRRRHEANQKRQMVYLLEI